LDQFLLLRLLKVWSNLAPSSGLLRFAKNIGRSELKQWLRLHH
jgi:hypothetical protein